MDDFASCKVGEPKPQLFEGDEVGKSNGLQETSPLKFDLCEVAGQWGCSMCTRNKVAIGLSW